MPQGLQCFDENGKIIVDLTDSQLTEFASLTIGEAIAPLDVYGYFGSAGIGGELTLQGINPETTVGFVTGIQAGTEKNVVGMQRCIVSITAPNKYVLSCFEQKPSETSKLIFYKFR
ncbi:hypothetical protein PGK08_014435 [Acinetobacter baumannii]|uniref:hypothetical protein n=1 Tax=Acinetobacter baumannii TaxID=470 RepID=UPI0022EB87CF|nr:hypothetical protein [Acinetobacter baumannii]MDA3539447.1 hypothetical protein [Acinetobacter baumannii]MDA3548369.1 hypothetical protein [Acinetobacter baumannii]MDA4987129.1 hypothetical protein [Acinetobacter baumannii]MDQ9840290.1 hypothetical protein [Acinetobacter baumannii]